VLGQLRLVQLQLFVLLFQRCGLAFQFCFQLFLLLAAFFMALTIGRFGDFVPAPDRRL
jgi:hypothetical protein